jgi:hypothetical protein
VTGTKALPGYQSWNSRKDGSLTREMSNSFKKFGRQCGQGWRSLYEPLIARCRAEGVGIQALKEKFGQLRINIEPGGSKELNEAILAAEAASAEICEICGEPGERSSWKGLVMTRCPTHRGAPASVG